MYSPLAISGSKGFARKHGLDLHARNANGHLRISGRN